MRIIQLYDGEHLIASTGNEGSTRMFYQKFWGDTTIPPEQVNEWRRMFPNLRYREVEVIEEAELIKGENVESTNNDTPIR